MAANLVPKDAFIFQIIKLHSACSPKFWVIFTKLTFLRVLNAIEF